MYEQEKLSCMLWEDRISLWMRIVTEKRQKIWFNHKTCGIE